MAPLTKEEIVKMRAAGRLAGQTLQHVGRFVRPGVTTEELDKIVYDYTLTNGAVPAPLGYHGFPRSVCTSVNACICHGVPDATSLKEGDIINIDVTSILDGFYGDTSATFLVGQVSDLARDITDCAEKAMWKGIEAIGAYVTTGDVGFAIGRYVTKRGYHVVRDIGGHGIGKVFHDDPFMPSYGKKGRGPQLLPWCCVTVEPMINETAAPIQEIPIPGSDIKYYQTSDLTLSAQFEHTVLVTDKGYEIMTLP